MLYPYLKSENNYLFVKLLNKHNHPKNIRKKLGTYGPVDWLETVRGLGYKIVA
jgi:DNA-binding response OmpR family regulator